MSKRSRARRGHAEDAAPSQDPPAVPEGADLLRRGLLGLLTALIVSRPLLRGESLGLSSDLSDAGGLLWVFLVLLGGLGWATWRMHSRQLAVQFGRVELALALGVGLLLLGAAWASYRRAAFLAGWEWAGLVLALLLTRQLARSEREQQGVFAVLLATGVAMAVQGAYQSAYELPRQRREVEDVRADMQAARGMLLGAAAAAVPQTRSDSDMIAGVRHRFTRRLEAPDAAEADLLGRRLAEARAHGPYLYPSTLAGAMALLVPGLVAAAFAARRRGAQGWQSALAMTAAGVCIGALILTREWLFMLPLVLVGGSVAALATKRPARGVLASIGLTGLLAAGLHWSGLLQDDIERRGDAWGASWRLIQQDRHPLTGVGPAMSPFWLPRHLSETAGTVLGPSSAPLELWAEGGLFVLLVFAAAAVLAVVAVWRWWATTPPAERDAPHQPAMDLPLEYYLGGMAGVLIAFMVRASLLVQEDLFPAAMLAALGALSWFASFAVFEQLAWTKGERMAALMAGVAALAAALLVNPGLGMPSLAGLLFVMLGLMLALAEPAPVRWLGHPGVGATLPVPVLLAGTFGFLIFILVPTTATASAHRRARLDGYYLLSEMSKPPGKRAFKDPREAVHQVIIKPLAEAEKSEKEVVKTCVLLAVWYGQAWSMGPMQDSGTTDADRAAAWAVLAHGANRESTEGQRTEAEIRGRLGEVLMAAARNLDRFANDKKSKMTPAQKKLMQKAAVDRRTKAREEYDLAAKVLGSAIPRDPTNPHLRYQRAELMGQGGDLKGRREEAAEAKRLDDRVRGPRRLSIRQRQEVEGWLKAEPAR